MARVLCLSSQTVYGPVGNSAAVPPLLAQGHDVLALPTVLLSHHPGLGKPVGQQTPASLLEQIFESLTQVGAFENVDAVLTGYFASSAQVIAATKQIATLKAQHPTLHVLVDPVLGDHGKLYVAEDVAQSLRDALLPLATISTPNHFELSWLTGTAKLEQAISALAVPEIIVTSVPHEKGLETRLMTPAETRSHIAARQPHVPHGTGDFLAGCYLAHRLQSTPAQAFEASTARLMQAISRSHGMKALSVC